jgi:hypothetical protein
VIDDFIFGSQFGARRGGREQLGRCARLVVDGDERARGLMRPGFIQGLNAKRRHALGNRRSAATELQIAVCYNLTHEGLKKS